jgi:hypothetical protein
MDVDNPGLEAGASRPSATSLRAKKRRRGSSPQEETLGESSRSKKVQPFFSTNPATASPSSPIWPPSQPDGGHSVFQRLGPYPWSNIPAHPRLIINPCSLRLLLPGHRSDNSGYCA